MKKKSKDKLEINRIRFVMLEKKVSPTELAEIVKKTPASIRRICRNESQPPLGLLYKIALVLDVDIRDLLNSTPVSSQKRAK
ncbi:MAG: helix-turn-helix transcriptional regulator [Bacteroidetes bacterium]|nr:helix-turn-helix transcriptional regulator [Bacteroidota bacterium]